jgi:transcription initiation factor IIF auxiliary subunit
MLEDFEIEQSADYEGEDWWTWAVWVEGDAESLDQIEFVEWSLHPTFSNPIRKIYDRSSNFRLETGGWGTFPIVARVHMKDGRDAKLRHYLELLYSDGTPTEK